MRAAALFLLPCLALAQTQEVKRDSTKVAGGFGRVDSALRVVTATGKAETAYEWGLLSLMNNFSDAGENVAVYGQTNALGRGPSWGGVFEVADDQGRPGAMVGTELTMNMSGRDSGLRLGLDVVLADGKYWRGKGSSDYSEGTIGVRVGTQGTSTSVKSWGLAYGAYGFRTTAFHSDGDKRFKPEGWMATGTYGALLSTYGGLFDYFLRLGSASPAFSNKPAGPYIGKLRIEIDGNAYAIPIHSWGQ